LALIGLFFWLIRFECLCPCPTLAPAKSYVETKSSVWWY
jgi:hypothetical protein